MLLVAGGADESREVQEFLRKAEIHPNIRIREAKIANEHVQYYLRAADAGLAAYSKMLNSGAILLYQTFDLPVVASHSAAIATSVPDGTLQIWDGKDHQSLAEAMIEATEINREDVIQSIRSFTASRDPEALSGEFARALGARLGVRNG